MNAKTRTILVLIGIFLAGVATGMLLPWRVFSPVGKPHGPRPMMARILARMEQRLDLTVAQRQQIEAIMRPSSEKLDRLRRESFSNGAAEIQAMNAKIAAVLTPEQREKFAQMQREQRDRMRRFDREPIGPHREGEASGEALPPPPED